MIFSKKIYKITNGINSTLYPEDKDNLILFTLNKTLRKYRISLITSRNCVFLDEYNYSKIIQISPSIICFAGNSYISKKDLNNAWNNKSI